MAPEASGRPAVRATCRSMSRSHRSFTTQPAARITRLPIANSATSHALSRRPAPDQQDAPQAGQEQQPGADRPVQPRQQHVGQPGAGQPGDPAAGGDVGMGGHGANLPASMSGSIRLFVSALLAEGATVHATPGQAHYLGTVMRRGPDAPVRLFNGADGEWQARIAAIKRDRAVLTVETRLRAQTAEPGPWLVFALLKRDATDLVAQKATELGVSALLPVITERTNAGTGQRGQADARSPPRRPSSPSG